MQAVAYCNTGVAHRPAAELEPFVLLLEAQPEEKRHIANSAAAAEAVRVATGVRVERVQMSTLPGAAANRPVYFSSFALLHMLACLLDGAFGQPCKLVEVCLGSWRRGVLQAL